MKRIVIVSFWSFFTEKFMKNIIIGENVLVIMV